MLVSTYCFTLKVDIMLYPKFRRHVGVQKFLCHKVRHHAGIQLLFYPTYRHYAGSHKLLHPTGKHFTNCNTSTLYKLLSRSIVTYAAPVCSSTCSSVCSKLQVVQAKYLIGNHPRRTSTSHLHYTLITEPIRVIMHRLTAKIFAHCSSHPNPQSNEK